MALNPHFTPTHATCQRTSLSREPFVLPGAPEGDHVGSAAVLTSPPRARTFDWTWFTSAPDVGPSTETTPLWPELYCPAWVIEAVTAARLRPAWCFWRFFKELECAKARQARGPKRRTSVANSALLDPKYRSGRASRLNRFEGCFYFCVDSNALATC